MSKQGTIIRVGNMITEYYKEVLRGKRMQECINFCNKTIKEIEDVIDGTSNRGLMSMIDFMGGRKQVPIKDEQIKTQLQGIIGRLNLLREEAEDIPECKHRWIIISQFMGISGFSVDTKCSLCESVVTTYKLDKMMGIILYEYPLEKRGILSAELGLLRMKKEKGDSMGWWRKANNIARNYCTENNIPMEKITRNLLHERGL